MIHALKGLEDFRVKLQDLLGILSVRYVTFKSPFGGDDSSFGSFVKRSAVRVGRSCSNRSVLTRPLPETGAKGPGFQQRARETDRFDQLIDSKIGQTSLTLGTIDSKIGQTSLTLGTIDSR
jgi:hypothetical protein